MTTENRGRGKRIPPETILEILRLYSEPGLDKGWLYSPEEIAAIVGYSAHAIRKVLRACCVEAVRAYYLSDDEEGP